MPRTIYERMTIGGVRLLARVQGPGGTITYHQRPNGTVRAEWSNGGGVVEYEDGDIRGILSDYQARGARVEYWPA